jgi:hypothetical protein
MASKKIITDYEKEWKRNKAKVVYFDELSEIFVKEMRKFKRISQRIVGLQSVGRNWTFKI